LYENEARGLISNGFCQDDGVAFHRSPAMRYYLAVGHALFGESGYGIILFQQLLRGGTAILLMRVTRRMTDLSWLRWATAVLIVLLPGPMALSLRYWPETLGAFLFAAFCVALLQQARMPRQAAHASGMGLLSGLLALVRTNAISVFSVIVL